MADFQDLDILSLINERPTWELGIQENSRHGIDDFQQESGNTVNRNDYSRSETDGSTFYKGLKECINSNNSDNARNGHNSNLMDSDVERNDNSDYCNSEASTNEYGDMCDLENNLEAEDNVNDAGYNDQGKGMNVSSNVSDVMSDGETSVAGNYDKMISFTSDDDSITQESTLNEDDSCDIVNDSDKSGEGQDKTTEEPKEDSTDDGISNVTDNDQRSEISNDVETVRENQPIEVDESENEINEGAFDEKSSNTSASDDDVKEIDLDSENEEDSLSEDISDKTSSKKYHEKIDCCGKDENKSVGIEKDLAKHTFTDACFKQDENTNGDFANSDIHTYGQSAIQISSSHTQSYEGMEYEKMDKNTEATDNEPETPFGFVIDNVVGVSQEEFDRQDSVDPIFPSTGNNNLMIEKQDIAPKNQEETVKGVIKSPNVDVLCESNINEGSCMETETIPDKQPRVESYPGDEFDYSNVHIKQEPMDDDDYIQEHDYYTQLENTEQESDLVAEDLFTYQDMFDITENGSYKCKYCSAKLLKFKAFKVHVDRYHQKSYSCHHCNEIFSRSQELAIHCRKNHPKDDKSASVTKKCKVKSKETPSVLTEKERLYTCRFCDKTFNKTQKLANHVQWRHKKERLCQMNVETNDKKMTIKVENSSEVPDQKLKPVYNTTYKCTQCPKIFHKQQKMAAHVRNYHPRPKPTVDKGEQANNVRSEENKYNKCNLQDVEHNKIESTQPKQIKFSETFTSVPSVIFKCKLCLQTFKDRSALKGHLNIVHAQHCCRYCPKTFHNLQQFINHSLQHLGDIRHYTKSFDEVSFKCKLCKYRITTHKSQSRRHVQNHLKGKNPSGQTLSLEKQIFLECSECGQPFMSREYLLKHEMLHVRSRGTPQDTHSKGRNHATIVELLSNPCVDIKTTPHKATEVQQQNIEENRHEALLKQTRPELVSVAKIPFRCGMCDACFPNSQYLLHHMTLHMNGQYIFKIEVDKKKEELKNGSQIQKDTNCCDSDTVEQSDAVEQSASKEMASAIVSQLSNGSNMASIITPENGALFQTNDDHNYTSKSLTSLVKTTKSSPESREVGTSMDSGNAKKVIILPVTPGKFSVDKLHNLNEKARIVMDDNNDLSNQVAKHPLLDIIGKPHQQIPHGSNFRKPTPRHVNQAVEKKIRELLDSRSGKADKSEEPKEQTTKYTSLLQSSTVTGPKVDNESSFDDARPRLKLQSSTFGLHKFLYTVAVKGTTDEQKYEKNKEEMANSEKNREEMANSENNKEEMVTCEKSIEETANSDTDTASNLSDNLDNPDSPVVESSSDSDSDDISGAEELFERTEILIPLKKEKLSTDSKSVLPSGVKIEEGAAPLIPHDVTMKNYKKQLDFAQGKWFECEFCMYLCKTHEEYKTHLDLHKSVKKSKLVKCLVCGRKFISKWHLNKHMEAHSNMYFCVKCETKFKTAADVMEHMQVCQG